MKGTASRGYSWATDEASVAWLRQSEKNQAENVMIVDMIRNDMGRVATVGSVSAPRLFDVERYPTVLQMTSTVQSETQASLVEIMQALFPCASITGAPKVRTMQIIADLETEPRGVYTGSIGFIAPDRRVQFNVAIRTVVVDKTSGWAEYGVGSGIVWDSDAEDEYRECRIKASVLTQPPPEFDLLESLLWDPTDGYFLLERHLQRLQQAARYFVISLDADSAVQALHDYAETLPAQPHKVRLLVSQQGDISVEAAPIDPDATKRPLRLGLATDPVQTANPFLFHKTTHRTVYDQALASRPDCDDVAPVERSGRDHRIDAGQRGGAVRRRMVHAAGRVWPAGRDPAGGVAGAGGHPGACDSCGGTGGSGSHPADQLGAGLDCGGVGGVNQRIFQ